MAGLYTCLASSNRCASLAPPYLSKLRTKPSSQREPCYLPMTNKFHCPNQYRRLRVSTNLTITRPDHARPRNILRAKPRCYAYSEFISVEKISNAILKSPYPEPWVVPWNSATVLIFLYLAHAWKEFHHRNIVPLIYHRLDKAYFASICYISRELVKITILYLCLHRFRPLPPYCFNISLKGNWMFDVIIACLFFPLVACLELINYSLVRAPPKKYFTSLNQEAKCRRDYTAVALEMFTITVCAPISEEIVYRGFLIPSLLRDMPLHWSIMLSSVYFAEMHKDENFMLSRTFSAIILAVVFARSRNLLPPMLLHLLWNMLSCVKEIRFLIGLYW